MEVAEISKLSKIALEYYRNDITDEETESKPMTEEFWEELDIMIEEGELINIAVLGGIAGPVISGKSTAAIAIAEYINRKLGKEMTKDYICAEQSEWLTKVMDSTDKYEHSCLVLDEFSALFGTGVNASTEMALFEEYADVQAQKFTHRVSCSPRKIADPNATIVLETLSMDKGKKETKCNLHIRINAVKGQITQLIGFVKIPVGKVMGKEFYKVYRKKKKLRMDLINKHGVKSVRDLEFAEIVMAVYNKKEGKGRSISLMPDEISTAIEVERMKRGKFFSLLAADELLRRIKALLRARKAIAIREEEILQLKQEAERKPSQALKQRLEQAIKEKQADERDLKELLEHYKKLEKLYTEWKNIKGDEKK